MAREIKRGEIYWSDWNPARGSEQSGVRPSLIIQNNIGNKFSPTTIIAAVTTAYDRPFPFLVKVTAKESGLPQDSFVNVSRILTVDRERLQNKCGELSPSKMAEVDSAIKVSLAL